MRFGAGINIYPTNQSAARNQCRIPAIVACVALAFASVSISASAAPFAGPEFKFGAPAYVAAPYGQENARIAFNGSCYLVVWDDHRDDTIRHSTHIYGTRISTNGTILDPEGIRIDKGLTADAYY